MTADAKQSTTMTTYTAVTTVSFHLLGLLNLTVVVVLSRSYMSHPGHTEVVPVMTHSEGDHVHHYTQRLIFDFAKERHKLEAAAGIGFRR